MTSTTLSRVFLVPELLEGILSNLEIKDLLFVQRVSRAFRVTIQGSPRLRKRLFLEPRWNRAMCQTTSALPVEKAQIKPVNNRLLLRAFPSSFPSIASVKRANHPDLIGLSSSTPCSQEDEHWSWDVCISFPADDSRGRHPAVDYPEASWRKMQLCQPACQSLYHVRRYQRRIWPAIVREGGITMGDFVDEVSKTIPMCLDRQWPESWISSDRDWHFEGNIGCKVSQ